MNAPEAAREMYEQESARTLDAAVERFRAAKDRLAQSRAAKALLGLAALLTVEGCGTLSVSARAEIRVGSRDLTAEVAPKEEAKREFPVAREVLFGKKPPEKKEKGVVLRAEWKKKWRPGK